jgi:hypothetical protein
MFNAVRIAGKYGIKDSEHTKCYPSISSTKSSQQVLINSTMLLIQSNDMKIRRNVEEKIIELNIPLNSTYKYQIQFGNVYGSKMGYILRYKVVFF